MSNSFTRNIVTTLLLLCSAFCFWQAMPSSASRNVAASLTPSVTADTLAAQAPPTITTRPIETLKPGQRALARNPEVSHAERTAYVEPDFHTWLLLSLEMPKPDGSTLFIEMLRSQQWFAQQVRYVVAEDPQSDSTEHSFSPDGGEGGRRPDEGPTPNPRLATFDVPLVPLSPLHPVYRNITEVAVQAQDGGAELVGLTVEMDLPELGLTGDAIVTDINTNPQIEPKNSDDDPRRVITATFHHTSGDVIDLTITDGHGQNEAIGTTSNHPFWSVDRQEYVQAGSLEIGERLKTLHGETKVVVSNLARPGPQTGVYNLEVHAEHVYFVGEGGVLVHNSQNYTNGTQIIANRKSITLGLGSRLSSFSAKVKGVLFPTWRKHSLTAFDPNNFGQFPKAFAEAASNAKEIHFNLNGFRLCP
ncbi:MAG: polymorphic toxin-type HINT domain-containing protein [Planctomycetaceae bacterium]